MPTEPLAALVYVVLLVPGIAYSYQTEKLRPRGKRSVFRETATVVVASSTFLVLTLFLSLVVALFVPAFSSWLDVFISNPAKLFLSDPRLTLISIFGGLLLASAMGIFFGSSVGQAIVHKVLGGESKIRHHVSAWSTAFELHPEANVMVSVQLKSGNFIYGQLFGFSPTPDEDSDRAFTLSGPIHFRGANADDIELLENANMVVVHASEIDYLSVAYVHPEAEPAPIAE